MTSKFKTQLYRYDANGDETELNISVEYSYSPGCKGSRDRYGRLEEPDDPEELEINSVVDVDTMEEMELTEDEMESVESDAWEDVRGTLKDAEYERGEAMYEARQDAKLHGLL